MTRVAIIVSNSMMKSGLWSPARSESRIPLNWAALLAANGYDVVVVTPEPDAGECHIPGVRFVAVDDVGSVDWVLFGSTSSSHVWPGLGTINARHVIRLQWPTGKQYQRNGEILAVAHPCLEGQVRSEGGDGVPCVVLPSPSLPLEWWQAAAGMPKTERHTRPFVLWAAREAFGGAHGTSDPWGERALSALEQLLPGKGLQPYLLNRDDYRPEHGQLLRDQRVWDRFAGLGVLAQEELSLGGVLDVMRQSVITVTLPTFKGPTLSEAVFEYSPPLVWDTYGAFYPELVAAAEKFGLLLRFNDEAWRIKEVIERLLNEPGLRWNFLEKARFAFAENSPAHALDAWRAMEARYG